MRKLIYLLKDAMLAHGWTVVGSCGYDGANFDAGMDGVDRWINQDAVTGVWYGAPNAGMFSWIVLRNTAINATGQGYQVYIAPEMFTFSMNYPIVVIGSWSAGFTGGGTSTRPTATDQLQLLSSAQHEVSSGINVARGFNMLTTTDHMSTRILFSSAGGTVLNMWSFERHQDPKSWLTTPILHGCKSPIYANVNAAAGFYTQSVEVRGITAYFSGDGLGTLGALGALAIMGGADPNGNWMCSPVGIVGASAQVIGYMGRLQDAFWVHNTMANGDYYPNDGSRAWVVFGDIMHASDGTAVVLD
jgi:hypothetical protein